MENPENPNNKRGLIGEFHQQYWDNGIIGWWFGTFYFSIYWE
jgi:hypothetical protein